MTINFISQSMSENETPCQRREKERIRGIHEMQEKDREIRHVINTGAEDSITPFGEAFQEASSIISEMEEHPLKFLLTRIKEDTEELNYSVEKKKARDPESVKNAMKAAVPLGAALLAVGGCNQQELVVEEISTEAVDGDFGSEGKNEDIIVESIYPTREEILEIVKKGAIIDLENKSASNKGNERNIVESNTLALVASTYVTDDPQKAVEISQIIRGDVMADSSNICGPLATSILLGWGLNEDGIIEQSLEGLESVRLTGVEPNDMWLGTPETTPERFEAAFPDSEYNSWHITESIGLLDFNNIEGIGELEVGDFLYLDGGSFTHYLAITKKDEQGQIYSVTNYINDNGEFVIGEVMLWAPETGTGFFRDLAIGIGPERAYTGRSGFYLWRRRDVADNILTDSQWEAYRNWFVDTLRNKSEGDWNIEIYELNNGEMFEWRSGMSYHSASTIKVSLSVVAMQSLEDKYPDQDLVEIINSKGYEGRTFAQLFEAMLVNSEELATEQLADFVSETFGSVNLKISDLGLEQTTYYPRRTNQRDMLNLWEDLYTGELLSEVGTDIILSYLEQYTSNDDTLLGSIREFFPEGSVKIYNKRGVITDGILTVQDTGIVVIDTPQGKRVFYFGIAGESSLENGVPYEQMVDFIDLLVSKLGQYISGSTKSSFDKQKLKSYSLQE